MLEKSFCGKGNGQCFNSETLHRTIYCQWSAFFTDVKSNPFDKFWKLLRCDISLFQIIFRITPIKHGVVGDCIYSLRSRGSNSSKPWSLHFLLNLFVIEGAHISAVNTDWIGSQLCLICLLVFLLLTSDIKFV